LIIPRLPPHSLGDEVVEVGGPELRLVESRRRVSVKGEEDEWNK